MQKTLGICFIISVISAACSQPRHETALKTVAIPQTPVQNQDKIGFCWAYSTMALIESQYKLKTGKTVVLSPEALGFYRMVEGLYQMTRIRSAQDIIAHFALDNLQGYWVVKEGSDSGLGDAMRLIDIYGVIPESAWRYKFTSESQVEEVTVNIKAGLVKLVWAQILKGKDASELTRQDIIDKVMTFREAFPSAPPAEFAVDGQMLSAREYLGTTLQFDPHAFDGYEALQPKNLTEFLAAIKRSLIRGVDPIIGFPVQRNLLNGDTFSGKSLKSADDMREDGWHAVAVTDFVNIGSSEGALPSAQIVAEFKRPTTDIDYIVIKNSWGTEEMKDTDGTVHGSKTGYYKIDYSYLEASVRRQGLDVVVPADIAANPLGDESVNPAVAAK